MPEQRRYRTGDQALVRQMNLSVIMNHLRENGPVSRAALAELSGLNKTTVSSLVQELIGQRFVEEFGLNSAGAGRPAMLLRLNPAAGYIVAAEVGVDFLSVICTNFAAEITWRHREATGRELDQRAIVDRMLTLLSEANRSTSTADGPLLGIAVGVPGLVDQETGCVLFAPNLGWTGVPLRSVLHERFDAPAYVDNEANLAALGECYFGSARGYDNVLFLSLGIGLGGGIVKEGKLYRGGSGLCGEFGHMTMDPDGLPCSCGNRGCWETQVSPAAVLRYVRQAVMHGQTSRLPVGDSKNPELLTLALVLDAARMKDAAAAQALAEVGRRLGIGVASLVNALNPDLVILGGRLSSAGEFLLPAVEAELRKRALRWNAEATQVVLASYGVDACVMGGVAAVTQAVLRAPHARGSGELSGPAATMRAHSNGTGVNAVKNRQTPVKRTPAVSRPRSGEATGDLHLLADQELLTTTEQEVPSSE
jgi:glucokinase-like ROK family protein